MKKHILITVILILITSICCGCFDINNQIETNNKCSIDDSLQKLQNDTIENIIYTNLSNHISDIGIYTNENIHSLIKDYTCDWPKYDNDSLWNKDTWTYPGKTNLIYDLGYFTVIPSQDSEIMQSGNFADFYNQYDNDLCNRKIAYHVSINLINDDTPINFYVFDPNDTFKYEEYFEIYLYDDIIHSNDDWYSHVSQSDVTDETQYTTIKITLRNKCYDIDKIILTAFLYNPTDITNKNNIKENYYMMNDYYSINILKK